MAPTKKTPAKKAAPKRKSTARKVTKASAPKAEVAPTPVAAPATTAPAYDPQWHAKLEAYSALTSAGVQVPNELAAEVEGWIAQEDAWKKAQEQEEVAKKERILADNNNGPVWVRNSYQAPFSLRLERQDKKKRIELKPRGERGDMFPLEPGDEHDQVLITNLHTGLIEVIPNGEAKEILNKQTHNIQNRQHTPLAILTNELGENQGQMKLNVQQEYNAQGITVGYTQPQDPRGGSNIPAGALGITRPGEIVQHFVPTGGHPATVQSGPVAHLGQEAKEKIADDIARRKGVQGRPEDVLGLAVTVDPVQRN